METCRAYEKLQEQAAKSNDKSIKKQIAALERELNAKEEEINAVVGLYKEVSKNNCIHSRAERLIEYWKLRLIVKQ